MPEKYIHYNGSSRCFLLLMFLLLFLLLLLSYIQKPELKLYGTNMPEKYLNKMGVRVVFVLDVFVVVVAAVVIVLHPTHT